ncbi:ATP-binding protein [Streptomyces formicae]|uniref:histidine kinase n=1 Tax=Streptomyces formicae TaxID=1616117 RepID=A0A291Q4W8_9ACTN|nr:ATP-binding protein [Streptomyces formicae]ATL26543.1 Osmosensitive K+ channel histidine kinase KdpD [Streptomyces formicae]
MSDDVRPGALKVYLGSAPGVGKTCRMLDEAHRRAAQGTDVVVGAVECHGRPYTEALLAGLDVLPPAGGGLDLAALLARRPRLAVVDDLAVVNTPGGGRRSRRWQDIEELLAAGVDVITAVDIRHLESLNDLVEKITRVPVTGTVPDRVVRRARQIELVDMDPEALRRRMAHGGIHAPEDMDAALAHHFRPGNLTALRELALRRPAGHVGAALERARLAEATAEVEPVRAADRMRTALLRAVGHDLRTPLAAALAAVASLRSRDVRFSAEDRDALLATADESLAKLDRLVANLLDLSRLEAGALTLALRATALEEVVVPALEALPEGGHRIETRHLEEAPAVLADPPLLERVIANLMGNAARHSPPHEPVLVSASALADRVELRVVDRGPGLPPTGRDRLFAPFQRLGDTDNSTGLGLGLALARGLTEAMDGTLTPEDTPGGGLTMVLSLPCAARPGDLSPRVPAVASPGPARPGAAPPG